ncbi:uncharacterized protein LOC133155378 [Syngnathus typhle]|uniref:uncharacterized protein LOC133155378 n=1 Tax=Syngnathus typhle TaxID=161592 RepID=UPI002A6A07D6|nr:uncharacterized protein LOC133155378 [Syngnathus typhle]
MTTSDAIATAISRALPVCSCLVFSLHVRRLLFAVPGPFFPSSRGAFGYPLFPRVEALFVGNFSLLARRLLFGAAIRRDNKASGFSNSAFESSPCSVRDSTHWPDMDSAESERLASAVRSQASTLAQHQQQVEALGVDVQEIRRNQDDFRAAVAAQVGSLSQQMQDIVRLLTAGPTANPSSPVSPPIDRPAPALMAMGVRLAPPERYAGEPGGSKAFVTECQMQFERFPGDFPTERSRVAYMLSYLTGRARAWATAEWARDSPTCHSLSTFVEALRTVFDPVSSDREKARELCQLSQGRESVSDYAIRFRTLAAECGWNQTALYDLFLKGLSGTIQDLLVPLNLPSDLDALIALAVRTDNRLQDRKKQRTSRSATVFPPVARWASPHHETHRQGSSTALLPPEAEPMQLGRAKVSAEEKQRRYREGRCYYCGARGHLVVSCPERKTMKVSAFSGSQQKGRSLPIGALTCSGKSLQLGVLIDSGADESLIDWAFARQLGVRTEPLAKTVKAKALNGHALFDISQITEPLSLSFGNHHEKIRLHVVTSPMSPIILGYPWLSRHNPIVDWGSDTSLKAGLIRPSSSPAGAGLFFVGKKDGTLRPCIDYSPLNQINIKNRYPLPLMATVFDQLQQAQVFTKLDLRNAYHLVRIREGDEWKTGFNTPRGHFEYLVMPFGLTNAPAVFQAMINNDVLGDFIDHFVYVYLDDILIYSPDTETHEHHVKSVLQRLLDHRLYVKAEKSEFHVDTISFLGFIIAPGTVQMDPAKVSAVTQWPRPDNRKKVQQFLGFANFYRRFIRGFSATAAPLHALTSSTTPFCWTTEAEAAFQELKRRFSTAPILTLPDPTRQFVVEVDASSRGIGAVLSQRSPEDNKLHPCAYLSRRMTPAEQNYDVGDRELLAVKQALEEWRHWLEGAQQPFLVWTDHKNLQYIKNAKRLNSRQARWSLFFNSFNFTLSYRPGSKNAKPDALSRVYSPDPETKEPEPILHPRCVVGAVTWPIEEQVKQANGDAPPPDGCPTNRLFVPPPLRPQVIHWGHTSRLACHPGVQRTLYVVQQRFWWSSMAADVREYVAACSVCARNKNAPG